MRLLIMSSVCPCRSLQVPAAGEENAPPDSDSPTVSATMVGAAGAFCAGLIPTPLPTVQGTPACEVPRRVRRIRDPHEIRKHSPHRPCARHVQLLASAAMLIYGPFS